MKEEIDKPLAGVRVLDVTQYATGPLCTMMLADGGAEVIKIERPAGGDPMRQSGPFIRMPDGRTVSTMWLRFARNKKSMTLNLQTADGKAIFNQLVACSDVVVENYKPGTMARFGLDYETLRQAHKGLIYVSVSGFGQGGTQDNRYTERPAYDLIAQAMGGIMEITGNKGGPPLRVGTVIGDVFPGVLAAFGCVLALQHRNRTGQGQHVDVAMYDSMVALCERAVAIYLASGEESTRGREFLDAPYDVFKAKDGYVVIAASTNRAWANLCKAIRRQDLEGDPRLLTPESRVENYQTVLEPVLSTWVASRTKGEVVEQLSAHDAPAAVVQTIKEVSNCPHLRARGMWIDLEHSSGAKITGVGNPVHLSAISQSTSARVADLGEDTTDILADLLGFTTQRILALREAGVT